MVEWKRLETFANITIGEFVHKDKQDYNALYPVYNGGISNTGYYESFNNEENKIVISARGANAGYVNRVFVKYWAGNSCYSISVDQNVADWNFIYYYLKNNELKLIGVQQKGGIPAVSKKQISTFQIPIPSKSEQERIVSILDTFTSSIANLKEQIKERRKQYEHYRDQLLDLEGKNGVEMKTLNSVCSVQRGIRVVKKDLFIEGTIPVFQNSIAPMGYYSKSNYPGNIPYIICAGSSSGDIGFCTVPFWAADDCLCVFSDGKFNNKFIYYYLLAKRVFIKSKVRKGAMPRLSRQVIENLMFPISSKQEQSRIVTILNQFEASIANLEAQLKEREKQYEYYRNQLLTFE